MVREEALGGELIGAFARNKSGRLARALLRGEISGKRLKPTSNFAALVTQMRGGQVLVAVIDDPNGGDHDLYCEFDNEAALRDLQARPDANLLAYFAVNRPM